MDDQAYYKKLYGKSLIYFFLYNRKYVIYIFMILVSFIQHINK